MITASRSPCSSQLASRARPSIRPQDALTAARVEASGRATLRPLASSAADQALAQTPNDPILHEFRATVLFALQAAHKEAAATAVRRPHGRTRLELGDDGRPLSRRRHL